MRTVTLTLNGRPTALTVEDRMLLSDALRETAGATEVHVGCEYGVCGLCTVSVDGVSVRSCLLFAVQLDGSAVDTVRSLGTEDDLGDLQDAFVRHHGLQCGFCTPAMLVVSDELLRTNPDPSEQEIREALSGVTCRCTGYQGIVDAVGATAMARRTAGAQ